MRFCDGLRVPYAARYPGGSDILTTDRSAKTTKIPMANVTYYVALAFMRSEDGDIVACEPKEARA